MLIDTVAKLPLCTPETWRLSCGIASSSLRRPRRCEPPHAIFMNAVSPTRRDGPDVFQRLKIDKETTPGIVRWPRVPATT